MRFFFPLRCGLKATPYPQAATQITDTRIQTRVHARVFKKRRGLENMKRIDQRENTGTSYHGDLCVCLWQSVCERHVRVDKLMEASGVRRLRGRSRSSRKENWDTSLNVRRNSTALNKTIVLSGQTWNQTHTHTPELRLQRFTKITKGYRYKKQQCSGTEAEQHGDTVRGHNE